MRARRLLALVVTVLAASLLSGCVQIVGLATDQPGTVGPVRLSHDLCISSSTTCVTLTSSSPAGIGQALVAYRIPTWAPDPTNVRLRIDTQTIAMVEDPGYASALLGRFPALVRTGERWVAFRAASPSPAFAANSTPTATLEASFDLPDDEPRLFSHFTITGFRWLVSPTDPSATYSPTRPHVCGVPIPAVPGASAYTDTFCVSGFWPRTAPDDADPADNPSELVTRNRLQLRAPGVQQLQAGQRAELTFSAAGAPTFAGTKVPVSASTTIPGASVLVDPQLTLAAGGSILARVDVPASTPPGDYDVSVFAGIGADGRRATGIVRVLAPPATPTPVPTTTPVPTATPAPITTPTPTPTPAAGTFSESVSSAAAALAASGARDALRRGRLRLQVRASAKGRVRVELRTGKLLLAKGTAIARRKGLVTVKLKLTSAGTSALSGRDALTGTLKVRFAPLRGKGATTSVPVTIAAG